MTVGEFYIKSKVPPTKQGWYSTNTPHDHSTHYTRYCTNTPHDHSTHYTRIPQTIHLKTHVNNPHTQTSTTLNSTKMNIFYACSLSLSSSLSFPGLSLSFSCLLTPSNVGLHALWGPGPHHGLLWLILTVQFITKTKNNFKLLSIPVLLVVVSLPPGFSGSYSVQSPSSFI